MIVGIFIIIPMLFFGYNYYTKVMQNTWYTGTPSVLQQKHDWISTSSPAHHMGEIKFIRYEVHSQNHYGIDPIQQDYNKSGKRISSGCASSAFACINPHYRYISDTPWNVTYELTSGGAKNPSQPKSNTNNSLYYELHNTIGHDFGSTWIIRVIGNHFKLWSYNQENGKTVKKFMGTYSQIK